jgi:hypothetical protein
VNRVRLVAVLSIAVAVAIAGACGGSAGRSGNGSSPPTSVPGKLVLEAAGTAATAAKDAGAAIFPERPTEYVLDAALPDLGETASVRRMNAHSVSAADVQRFADALGVAGTPTHTASGWQVQGADSILQFAIADGVVAVSYSLGTPEAVGGSTGSGTAADPGGIAANGSEKGVPPAPAPVPTTPTVVTTPAAPVDVPGATDAETIARTLLDRLGVLSGLTWSTDTADSGGVATACPVGVPCPIVPPEVFARTVTFSLTVDGMRVDGVQWSVTIGQHRRIESLSGEWATPATIGDYPLRSTAAVFADLQHGKARYAGPMPMTAYAGTRADDTPAKDMPVKDMPVEATPSTTVEVIAVHVVGVSLGLARWNADDHGQPVVDLVPTYRFGARVDEGTPYDIVVLALDPSATTFANRTPTPKPLPPTPVPQPVPQPAPQPSGQPPGLPADTPGAAESPPSP